MGGCDAASDALCAVLSSRVQQCLWNYKTLYSHFKHTVELIYWAESRIQGMTPIFNVQVLSDVMSWWWVNSCQHFGQACFFHHHFLRSWWWRHQVCSKHWLTIYQQTRHHITEDMNLHQYCCENLWSQVTPFLFWLELCVWMGVWWGFYCQFSFSVVWFTWEEEREDPRDPWFQLVTNWQCIGILGSWGQGCAC